MDCVIDELVSIIGSQHVIRDEETLTKLENNTLGENTRILAQVSPSTRKEIISILEIANKHKVSVHPISCGLNVGYGDVLPPTSNQIVLKLHRLNRVLDFDNELGQVVLEPGVTQQALYEFLLNSNSDYFSDMTGSTVSSSVLGNIVDGGIGHSPLGNRRSNISEFEVILPDGSTIKTRELPAIGPDISGLFVQSNFGIVVSVKIRLNKYPEHFEAFMISIHDSEILDELISSVRMLLQIGTLNSVVHIGNSVRSLMSSHKCPQHLLKDVVSEENASELLGNRLLKPGVWNAVGGVYGTKLEVRAKKKNIEIHLPKGAKLIFFTHKKLSYYNNILEFPVLHKLDKGSKAKKNLSTIHAILDLLTGKPSDSFFENIEWKVTSRQEMGLIWLSPSARASGDDVRKMLTICKRHFDKSGFDMPVTLSFVTSTRVVAVIGIHFNKTDTDQIEKAHGLYQKLSIALPEQGFYFYRSPTPMLGEFETDSNNTLKLLRKIKCSIDINGIISVGRYGLT